MGRTRQAKKSQDTAFEFVNTSLPGSRTQDPKIKSLIRSNATKYHWQHSRKRNIRRARQASDVEETENTNFVELEQHSSSPPDEANSSSAANSAESPMRISAIIGPDSTDSFRPSYASLQTIDSSATFNSIELDLLFPADLASLDDVSGYEPTPDSRIDASSSTILSQESVDRLMKFSMEVSLPRLLLGAPETAPSEWFQRADRNTTVFYAFMFAAAAHGEACEGRALTSNSCDALMCHTEAIHRLNQSIQDPSQAATDDNILALLCLAFIGLDASFEMPAKRPDQAPLQGLQSIGTYGALLPHPSHFQGLSKLVEMRGGLGNIRISGLPEVISYGSLVVATRFLEKPHFPFVAQIKTSSPWPSPRALQHTVLGKGLRTYWSSLDDRYASQILCALDNICSYALEVLEYLKNEAQIDNMAVLADRRNFTQHALMSLPTKDDIEAEPHPTDPLYEPCRLAAIVFSLIVVFPIPPSTAPFTELGRRMREALKDQDFRQTWADAPELVMWILFMGGIAAANSDVDRKWYVSTIDRIAARQSNIDDWTGIERVLQDHLWLQEINDNDGRTLWREVESLDPFDA